jgi:tripartite-type tricarboxylate transporter receptor subunit TctC
MTPSGRKLPTLSSAPLAASASSGHAEEEVAGSGHKPPFVPLLAREHLDCCALSWETPMKLFRRKFLHLAASAATLPIVPCIAKAQGYPTRPVKIVVGAPAGGVNDLFSRLFGEWLSRRFSQPFIVENRPGAGGNIAAETVVRAIPDGYTIANLGSNNSWSWVLYSNVTFDLVRDLVPIASITQGLGVAEVHPSFPASSLPDLIAYARANPGKITMASGGVGTAPHIYGELFKQMAKVDMLHVPYRGGGPAMIDLLSGQVSFMIDPLATSMQHIKAGTLRALAVTSAKRSELLPDIPAISEFLPGYEATGWLGFGAPRGTPPEIIAKLNAGINAGLDDLAMKTRITELGYTAFATSPTEFQRFLAEYTERWSKIIRTAGIKAE